MGECGSQLLTSPPGGPVVPLQTRQVPLSVDLSPPNTRHDQGGGPLRIILRRVPGQGTRRREGGWALSAA